MRSVEGRCNGEHLVGGQLTSDGVDYAILHPDHARPQHGFDERCGHSIDLHGLRRRQALPDGGSSPGCAVVSTFEPTVGTRVCAITSVGTLAIPVPPAMPHTSMRAGPALTTRVLPLMVEGIGLTRTLAFKADACSRAASKVSDPVARETAP